MDAKGTDGPVLNEQLSPYRQHLVLAEQKAQEDYDKAVTTLSGGALAVSFAFLEKVVKAGPAKSPDLLFAAWILWAASIGCVMISYLLSRQALRKAITQVDAGAIYIRRPGGAMSVATELLNIASGALFIIGVAVVAVFVLKNLRS
jgi:hypothetical protein